MVKKLSRGLKKYVRQEKNRIRRKVLDSTEEKKLIKELYEKIGIKKNFSNPRSSGRSENKSLGK